MLLYSADYYDILVLYAVYKPEPVPHVTLAHTTVHRHTSARPLSYWRVTGVLLYVKCAVQSV